MKRRQPTALLQYIKGVTDKIGQIFKNYNIHTIFKLQTKLKQFLQ